MNLVRLETYQNYLREESDADQCYLCKTYPKILFNFSNRILTKVNDYNRLVFRVLYGSKKRFMWRRHSSVHLTDFRESRYRSRLEKNCRAKLSFVKTYLAIVILYWRTWMNFDMYCQYFMTEFDETRYTRSPCNAVLHLWVSWKLVQWRW